MILDSIPLTLRKRDRVREKCLLLLQKFVHFRLTPSLRGEGEGAYISAIRDREHVFLTLENVMLCPLVPDSA